MQQVVQIQSESAYQASQFHVYQNRQLGNIAFVKNLPEAMQFEMKVVASIFPFRVNRHVIEELIDWSNIPEDPIFQLTFPQRGMLSDEAFNRMADLIRSNPPRDKIEQLAKSIRSDLNPHPADQMEKNVPMFNGELVEGMQHKYKETVLFFPAQGQYCHSYCTFCFRWAQFVGKADRFTSNDEAMLHDYLMEHKEVSDLLITGGDPMVMRSNKLSGYLEALVRPELNHVKNIRIGTKSLTFWPQRFVTDDDADELISLLEHLVKAGKHVSIMAHINHLTELRHNITKEAIRRIRATGATIRTQAPLLNHINANADMWAQMWREQVRLGLVPYYMFVERDTGARRYFEIPLFKAWEIFRDAYKQVSGLCRTVRGPSMSCSLGKIEITGVSEINGEKVFVLRFIQARNAEWVQRPFFAKYDEKAVWLDDLKPAFGASGFFWENEPEYL